MTVKLQPGRLCGPFLRALAISRGDFAGAAGWASGNGYPDVISRALVSAHDLASESLLAVRNDMMEVLASTTAVDRIAAGRLVPFSTRGTLADGGAAASWVRDGEPIPLSTSPFLVGGVLSQAKVAAIAVVTSELARSAAPEEMILSNLVEALSLAIDTAFLDPTNEGSLGSPSVTAAPASVLFGVAPAANIAAALSVVAAGGSNLSRAAWVTHPQTASLLATTAVNSVPTYPGVLATGGRLHGIPVLTSLGSPVGQVALIDASFLRLATDPPELDVSRSATLQMDSAPTPGAASVTSMWQSNSYALRAVRLMSWHLIGTGHASYTTVV